MRDKSYAQKKKKKLTQIFIINEEMQEINIHLKKLEKIKIKYNFNINEITQNVERKNNF